MNSQRNRLGGMLILLVFLMTSIGCFGGGGGGVAGGSGSSNGNGSKRKVLEGGQKIDPQTQFNVSNEVGSLSIPASTFSEELTTKLVEETIAINISDLPDEILIASAPLGVFFSEAKPVNDGKSFVVSLKIDEAYRDHPGIYPLIRSNGERVNEEGDIPASGQWRVITGTRQGDYYEIPLFASAGEISFILVAPRSPIRLEAKLVATSPRREVARLGVGGQGSWADRPWLIYCDRNNLDEAAEAHCTFDEMSSLATEFVAASLYLSNNLSLREAALVQKTFNEGVGEYGAVVTSSQEPDFADQRHNLAVFTDDSVCAQVDAAGCYDYETHSIYLTDVGYAQAPLARAKTIIHELFHANQNGYAGRKLLAHPEGGWIVEGTAVLVGKAYTGIAAYGTHDWTNPLNTVDEAYAHYSVYRFFEVTLGVDSMEAFLSGIASGAADRNSYELAINGYNVAGNPFLMAFLDANFSFYENGEISCLDPITVTEEERTDTLSVFPMAAQCSSFKTEEEGKCVEIQVNTVDLNDLHFYAEGYRLEFGQAYSGGEEVRYLLLSPDIAAANDDLGEVEVTTRAVPCNRDLTGLWCATRNSSNYGSTIRSDGHCSSYSDYIRIYQEADGSYTATPFVFVCETKTKRAHAILRNGEGLSFDLPLGSFDQPLDYECNQGPWSFDLIHDGGNFLNGTYRQGGSVWNMTYHRAFADPNTGLGWEAAIAAAAAGAGGGE